MWYRQPSGYQAEEQLKELVGTEAAVTLGFITGFLQGYRPFTKHQKELLQEWANIDVPK